MHFYAVYGACICVSEKTSFHFQSKILCVTKYTMVRFLLQTINWQATIPWGTGLKYLNSVIVYKSSTLIDPHLQSGRFSLQHCLQDAFLNLAFFYGISETFSMDESQTIREEEK